MNCKESLKEYIDEDEIYQDYKQDKLMNCSDFDKFCIQHCKDIEELLEENLELEQALDESEKLINTILLCKGKYKNYNYYVLNLGTHPTAYIEIPKENKLYRKSYDEIYKIGCNIDVHGGLTYSDNELMGVKSENWFIGWDYAHCGDYYGYEEYMPESIRTYGKKWTTEEIIEECKNAIDQIIGFESKEIIEEPKKIEKIDEILRIDDLIPPYGENEYKAWKNIIIQQNKINELIDEINNLKEK